ncbi:MAG TPA: hypothetical protein VFQ89_00070, partial [Candidatus Binatia bacterium]|nr:hypothetical protein [Candidatus Binatia bacterium]
CFFVSAFARQPNISPTRKSNATDQIKFVLGKACLHGLAARTAKVNCSIGKLMKNQRDEEE